MQTIKVVIGANFGDEGKGLMTDYFCHQAAAQGKSSCVVLHNGGAQRGHTVCLPNGKRHVFHHFSSGTFAGASTYFASTFVLNPMIFMDEVKDIPVQTRALVADPKCMVSTPYDMMFNQIVEEERGEEKHGSCGCGIFETISRYKHPEFSLPYADMVRLQRSGNFTKFLENIRDKYYGKKLSCSVPEKWQHIWYSKTLLQNYIADFYEMQRYVSPYTNKLKALLSFFDMLVFEGGQGLLLDQNNQSYFPHLTPSNTGLKNPERIIRNLYQTMERKVEVCYVTRSYITRHGAGRLDNECEASELSCSVGDKTNVPNIHQGTIRYARLDADSLLARIDQDFDFFAQRGWEKSLAVTHLDQLPSDTVSLSKKCFDKIYRVDGETRENVLAEAGARRGMPCW